MFALITRGIAVFFRDHPIDLLTIRSTIKHYSRKKGLADLRAGFNVALVAFPQSMAYAMVAGLPLQYGIYCMAVASVMGAITASSRFTSAGPTNATAVMVLSAFLVLPASINKLACLSLLVMMVGIFLMLGAVFRMASLTQFVSRSVVIGYVTGAAFLIISNQIQNVLGFTIGDADTFFGICYLTAQKISGIQTSSLLVGCLTLLCWLVFHRKFKTLPNVVITLVVMTFITQGLITMDVKGITMLKPVQMSDWTMTWPEFRFDWFSQLSTAALAIAFLAMLEGTFMAKILANRAGDKVDVNQEMFSFGVANFFSSIFSGMPASGSLTRSTLNWKSGAATCMASVMTGILCGIGVLTCGSLIQYIPKSSLAIVVICIALSLVKWHEIRISLKATKSDAAVLLVTFFAALLTPLYLAIFLGTAVSIALFLRKAGQPHMVEYAFNDEGNLCEIDEKGAHPTPQISIVHVEGNLFFGASEVFNTEIQRFCKNSELKVVILRLRNAHNLDATSVMALEELLTFLKLSGRHLLISGGTSKVYRVFKQSGFINVLGRKNFFLASVRNPNFSTRKAMKRAKELLG